MDCFGTILDSPGFYTCEACGDVVRKMVYHDCPPMKAAAEKRMKRLLRKNSGLVDLVKGVLMAKKRGKGKGGAGNNNCRHGVLAHWGGAV